MNLHEPDVSLTDLGLAVECVWFVILLVRHSAHSKSMLDWFVAFFAATGLAAFIGALAHGLVTDVQSALYKGLWLGRFASIGLAAIASWAIGARLILSDATARAIIVCAFVAFVIYMVIVLKISQSFAVAIIYYLPSAVFLFIAFTVAYVRSRERFFAVGTAGTLMTFLASLVQQTQIGFPYFDHNAFYHLIQAAALLLIFLAARRLTLPGRREA